jgi:hypothetical protein
MAQLAQEGAKMLRQIAAFCAFSRLFPRYLENIFFQMAALFRTPLRGSLFRYACGLDTWRRFH